MKKYFITILLLILLPSFSHAQKKLSLGGGVSIELEGKYFIFGASANYEKLGKQTVVKITDMAGVCYSDGIITGDIIDINQTTKMVNVIGNTNILSESLMGKSEKIRIGLNEETLTLNNNVSGLSTLSIFKEKILPNNNWDTLDKCKDMVVKLHSGKIKPNTEGLERIELSGKLIFFDFKNFSITLKNQASLRATENNTFVSGELIQVFLDKDYNILKMITSGNVTLENDTLMASSSNIEWDVIKNRIISRGKTKITFEDYVSYSDYLDLTLGEEKFILKGKPDSFIALSK